MSNDSDILILPYTSIIGQEQLKLALELAYIAPNIGNTSTDALKAFQESLNKFHNSHEQYQDSKLTEIVAASSEISNFMSKLTTKSP